MPTRSLTSRLLALSDSVLYWHRDISTKDAEDMAEIDRATKRPRRSPSFRDGPKDQTRNLELLRCAIAHRSSHLRCAPEWQPQSPHQPLHRLRRGAVGEDGLRQRALADAEVVLQDAL